jgi:hypothetical protein
MHVGKVCFALLALGAFTVGCSSSKSSDSDTGDHDDQGGTGGTPASGGTTNQGGTAGAAPSSGGTGTASESCANYCERRAACEGIVDPFCPEICAQGEDDAMGCLAEHRNLVDCIARLGPCTAMGSDCPTELAAIERCRVCSMNPSSPECG